MNFEVQNLPTPLTASGKPRHVGVEIEFGNLEAAEAARIFCDVCGGSVSQKGQHDFRVRDGLFGDVEVYLDTRFRKGAETWIKQAGLNLAQLVVPVEIVTTPLLPELLPQLDDTMRALARHGARGTSDGLILGFGVHLNVEIADSTKDHIGAVLTSFALLEPALRAAMQIDATRRILPFAAPYPKSLIDRLVAERGGSLDALTMLYLDENPTRNSALDMLPIFAHFDPDTVTERVNDDAVSARPAYHYRLPDCRLHETGWSITGEWNRWTVVEQAAKTEILAALCDAWLSHRAAWPKSETRWGETCSEVLDAHGLEIPA